MIGLVARIRIAFENVPESKFTNLCVGYDDEGINDFFGGRGWREINSADLSYHSAALTFFTAEAFHYFLPSFMIAGIEFPEEFSGIIDAIISNLTPPKLDPERPSFMERWKLFSPEQKQVTVDFLSYVNGKNNQHWLDDVIVRIRETIAA